MSLSAWEQQALESIKNELAGSDPELAALLSAFNRLESGEEMPDREKTSAGPRRAYRRLRRTRWRFSLRRMCRRPGFPGAMLLLLWLLATAGMIAVALVLNAGGNRGTCTEMAAMICAGPVSGHSPGPSDNATTGQVSHQQVIGITQTVP